MCMEDVRIGRKSSMVERNLPIGTASIQAAVASDSRVCLVLGAPLTGKVTYTTISPAVSGTGLVVTAGSAPVIFDIQHHGNLVTSNWFAICDTISQTVFVGQTLLMEK